MESRPKTYLKEIHTKEEFLKYHYNFKIAAKGNSSEADADLYPALAGYRNMFVGFIDDKPFCTFMFVEYPKEKILFFGLYNTLEEYRSLGLTFPLLESAYNELKKKNYSLMLTSWDFMSEKYNNYFGSQNFEKICVHTLKKSDYRVRGIDLGCIKKASEIDFKKLEDFDFQCCHYDRTICLDIIVKHEKIISFVYEKDGVILGFIALKRGRLGYRAAPFLAISHEVAHALLEKVLACVDDEIPLYIDFPLVDKHQSNLDMLVGLGFELKSTFVFSGQKPYPNDFSVTYSVFSNEFGL
jgi:hypothetical protein